MGGITLAEYTELKTIAPNERLFLDNKKQPVQFFIPPHRSEVPSKCGALVRHFGGLVHQKWTPGAITLIDSGARPDLSSLPTKRSIATYSIRFLKDSIVSNRMLSLDQYRVPNEPPSPSRGEERDSERRSPKRAQVEEIDEDGERQSHKAAKKSGRAAAENDEHESDAEMEEAKQARAWVARLSNETHQHPVVVFHALYSYSGKVRRAREFLLGQHVPEAEKRWKADDDERLLRGTNEDVQALCQRRSDRAVNLRLRWLEGHPVAV